MNQVQEQTTATATAEPNVKTMTARCEWCEVNGGRTHATRECCVLRRLAIAPRHEQAAYAAELSVEEKNALRPVLQAEVRRLKGMTA